MSQLVTYVALLRGINVGGNTPVSMTELKSLFEQLGLVNVQTYINSGNVIFESDTADQRLLEVQLEKMLLARLSCDITVVVRSLDEIQAIVAHIPESWQVNHDQKCNIMFLRSAADRPDIVNQFALKPDIEELHYFPGVLFWSADTTGLTRSSMMKVNRMPIYQEMTVRGVNTTRKIYELMCAVR